ncbi:MAG: hypothetical protein FJY85_04260 [Deltaproteobacteria bacterium]|nr:hypothetical protein [Deltaproteobacteria bacterium]
MTGFNRQVLITALVAIVVVSSMVPNVTAQDNQDDLISPQWYDSVFILCCGFDFDGKPFCTNIRRQECWAYRGRQVYDCKECEGAPRL